MIDENRDSDYKIEMRKDFAKKLSTKLNALLTKSFRTKEDVEERIGKVTLSVSYRKQNCRMNIVADDDETLFKLEKNIITNEVKKFLDTHGYIIDDKLHIQVFSDKISINFWTYFKTIETDFLDFCYNSLTDLEWDADFIQSYAVNVSKKLIDVEIKNLPTHKGIIIKTYDDEPFYFKEQVLVKNALVKFLNSIEHFANNTFSFKHDMNRMYGTFGVMV